MAKEKEFIVELTPIKAGKPYTENFKIDKSFFEMMENEEIPGADIEAAVEISARHDSYLLKLDCTGTLQAPCDRCLDPVDIDVDDTYETVIRFADDDDDSTDDTIVLPFNATRIDIAPVIYDTLMLAIPLRCVHPDGECNPEMAQKLDNLRTDGDDDDDESTDADDADLI